MDFTHVLTFDTLAFCAIACAVVREIWIRMTPVRSNGTNEDDMDRQFDLKSTPSLTITGAIDPERPQHAQDRSHSKKPLTAA
jgi:hypothetical protein